jgi:hypothetical protein
MNVLNELYPEMQAFRKNGNIQVYELPAKGTYSVIPANPGSGPGQAPESIYFKMFWTPAFAGVTIQESFYEIIKWEEK